MIIKDDHVESALAYLNERPHPLSRALLSVTQAENNAKRCFARAFLAATGTEFARKAQAETSEEYIRAKDAEAAAIEQLQDHREQKNGAEFLIECWRTEQSNIRAAEKVR